MRPLTKDVVDNEDQFAEFLNDVLENNLKIEALIADNPKRSFLRNSLQHSSKYACEYCFQCGVSFRCETSENTKNIVEKIDQQLVDIESQIDILKETSEGEEKINKLKEIEKNLLESKKKILKKKRHI